MRNVRVDKRRLETLMEMRGVNNRELSERMGLHINGVLRIKREQSTSIAGLQKLCDALECHPFDLIVAEGYPEPFLAAPASH